MRKNYRSLYPCASVQVMSGIWKRELELLTDKDDQCEDEVKEFMTETSMKGMKEREVSSELKGWRESNLLGKFYQEPIERIKSQLLSKSHELLGYLVFTQPPLISSSLDVQSFSIHSCVFSVLMLSLWWECLTFSAVFVSFLKGFLRRNRWFFWTSCLS